MTSPIHEARAREWLKARDLCCPDPDECANGDACRCFKDAKSLASLLAEVAQAEREKCADETQGQAQDRRLLQDLYAKKFGGHSFEQQREGHAALVLEELSHGLRARSTED